jgi:hypothetical protein
LKSGGSSGPTIDEILQFAENQYHLMKSTGKWTGVESKTNETFFIAALQAETSSGTKVTICFNCGGLHSFKSCPKPADKNRIRANQKLFKDQRKKTDSPKANNSKNNANTKEGKYAPPTETEKKNQSRRVIDGKLHYYHYQSKCWNLVKDPSTPQKQTGGPAMTIAANTATIADNSPGSTTPVISNTTRNVAVANAARQMELTFHSLLSQRQES